MPGFGTPGGTPSGRATGTGGASGIEPLVFAPALPTTIAGDDMPPRALGAAGLGVDALTRLPVAAAPLAAAGLGVDGARRFAPVIGFARGAPAGAGTIALGAGADDGDAGRAAAGGLNVGMP